MRRVFADSYYFFALVSKHDPKHQRALAFTTNFIGEVVTTKWVVTEIADGLCRPPSRSGFLQLWDRLSGNPRVRIEPVTDNVFNAGVELYRRRPDKPWSLTDCISFVVMEREGLTEALTGDHDFEQAGFVALLK